jgi:hypothetical protein
VRNYSELFPDALGNGCKDLILPVLPVVEDLKGKWGSRGTIKE